MTTVTVTVTTARTVTTTTTVAAGTSQTEAAAPCPAGDLTGSFSEIPGSAGAGQISYALDLKNTSGSSCFVTGLPAVRLLGAGGTALPTKVAAERPGANPGVKVSLAPGASARTQARFSPDVPGVGEGTAGGPCEPKAVQMRVTAPGGGTVVVPVEPPTSVCEHGSLRFDVFSSV
jgi:hypothetical protein